jgi:hypothetical protein
MHHKATNAVRPPSLVDTLSMGFRTLNRILPVLGVPLVINLWLWLGPRISIAPLLAWIRSFDPQTWDQARDQIAAAVALDQPLDLRTIGPMRFWQPIYFFPMPADAVQPVEPAVWIFQSFLTVGAVLVAINVLVMLLTAVFLVPLADQVREAPPTGSWLARVARTWLVFLGVLGIVLTALVVVGIPLLAIASALAAFVPVLGSFVVALLFAVMFWTSLSVSFAYDAIVLNQVGPVAALLASLAVVRRFFWGVLGLFLLKHFILAGLGFIWVGLTTTVPGVLTAIIASTYIAAGIAAAHLIFFRDRLPLAVPRPAR